jgi:hypothetical protein
MPNAASERIGIRYAAELGALIDAVSEDVAAEYVGAQSLGGASKLLRLESALRHHVAKARANARMLGALSLFDELPAIIGPSAGLVTLSMPASPDQDDVAGYIDGALELAASTNENTSYRALTIIESESVREFDLGHAMAERTLKDMPPARQKMLGFRVATQADLRRGRSRANEETYTARVPVLGRIWLAASDGRVCESCRAKHGELAVLATSFGGDTAPLHARCRCTSSLWAVDWEANVA